MKVMQKFTPSKPGTVKFINFQPKSLAILIKFMIVY